MFKLCQSEAHLIGAIGRVDVGTSLQLHIKRSWTKGEILAIGAEASFPSI